MKILVVEPDEYYHPQYRSGLHDIAHDVRIATDLASAQEALQSYKPDMLIMELLLPDQPGYRLLEELRKKFGYHAFPVIIYSKVENLEDILHSLNYGIAGYFIKGKNSMQDIRKLILNLSYQPYEL